MEHCCSTMTDQAEFTCDQHPDPVDCPDSLIATSEEFQEYGIRIHDGGSSWITIAYCPWCGVKLPQSTR